MSNKSEYVKRWRKNTKKRIIESMGGECQICGYLEFLYKTKSVIDIAEQLGISDVAVHKRLKKLGFKK